MEPWDAANRHNIENSISRSSSSSSNNKSVRLDTQGDVDVVENERGYSTRMRGEAARVSLWTCPKRFLEVPCGGPSVRHSAKNMCATSSLFYDQVIWGAAYPPFICSTLYTNRGQREVGKSAFCNDACAWARENSGAHEKGACLQQTRAQEVTARYDKPRTWNAVAGSTMEASAAKESAARGSELLPRGRLQLHTDRLLALP